MVGSESRDIDHQTPLVRLLIELINSISWSSAISMVPTSTNLIVDFFWGFFLGSERQPKQELNVCPIFKLDFHLQFVRQQFDEFFQLGKWTALIWQNFLKLVRFKFIFTHFSDEEGNLAKFSGKVGKKKLLKLEDKAEKKKQREAELLDREARKKRLEKEEQERNLQDAKGHAHDVFSRIFRILVTKFFYQMILTCSWHQKRNHKFSNSTIHEFKLLHKGQRAF